MGQALIRLLLLFYLFWVYKIPRNFEMKKKIIAICSSPNKGGNSETLLDSFLAGIPKDIVVKKFNLQEIDFADYSYKFSKEPDPEIEPKFRELCDAIKLADGIVIATPTYNFSVPAKLKNLIDRIGYLALDYKKMNIIGQPTGLLGDKKLFTIITGGTPNFFRGILFLIFPGFWLRVVFAYYGCFSYSTKYAGELTFSNPAKNKLKLLAKFQKLGERFGKRLLK